MDSHKMYDIVRKPVGDCTVWILGILNILFFHVDDNNMSVSPSFYIALKLGVRDSPQDLYEPGLLHNPKTMNRPCEGVRRST